ncbi:hypothetical protein K491DRAFT_614686, partial [Lophiostoma macrostomum CBS 122681]
SAPHSTNPHATSPNPPFTTGLIIAASVLVAAGIAIYESPQVRQWVDQSRRKIAVALHSLGDDIQPRRPSEGSEDYEARKRRQEVIRRNRNELIRRAREEGIAVDLDELARIGREEVELAERRPRRKTNASTKSFDDLVGSDGMLKKTEDSAAQKTTGTDMAGSSARRRGMAGFGAGAGAAAAANPFSDDNILFDLDDEKAPITSPSTMVDEDDAEDAPSPQPFPYIESRETSATVEANSPAVPPPIFGQLIDLTPELAPEDPQTASIPQSEADDNEQVAQSFYSFTSSESNPMRNSAHPQFLLQDDDEDMENISTGTLTPRSEHSAFTGVSTSASMVGSNADDIGILSMQNDDDHDARSEAFSESGFTDAGFSEAGFSEVGENRTGVMTPSSWTDVGSDDESEWGGPAQGGNVSQVQQ